MTNKTITAGSKVNAVLAKTVEQMEKSAASMVQTAKDAAEEYSHVSLRIEEANQELAVIEESIESGRRRAKAELDIRVLEDESAVLAELAGKQEKVVISKDDFDVLARKGRDQNAEITKAVAAAVAELRAEHELEKVKAEADNANTQATLKAAVTAKEAEISMLKTTIEQLQETVAEERKARIAIAEAQAKAQGVTVNTSGK